MKIIHCPLNGPRNAQEFVCGGEVKFPPAESAAPSDAADLEENTRGWVDYIFMEENRAGVVREWWCHVASGYWFIAERDTISDTFLRTYPSQELMNRPVNNGTGS